LTSKSIWEYKRISRDKRSERSYYRGRSKN